MMKWTLLSLLFLASTLEAESDGDTSHTPHTTAAPSLECVSNYGSEFCSRLQIPADRTYYIAATEIEWDYAPEGNLLALSAAQDIFPSKVWLEHGIGSKYIKAVYKGYTDESFTSEKPRSPGFKHMGLLGPAIRAFVGETVKIVFYNNASFTTNLHAHGALYDKTSEGAPYNDESTSGDQIAPQGRHVYIWKMRSAMLDKFTSSKMWLYHSHLQEIHQITAGLLGPIVVYRRKRGQRHLPSERRFLPWDINQEVFSFFLVFDEANSILFEKSFQKYMNASGELTVPQKDALLADADFVEGNVMHAINGYAFGNAVPLNMMFGDTVRWYLGTFGNEADGPHTVHWHGNLVSWLEESVDVVMMLPASTATVDMDLDAKGKWLYHCHVYDHIDAGMLSTYI